MQLIMRVINGELFYCGRPVKEISAEEREQRANSTVRILRAELNYIRENG